MRRFTHFSIIEPRPVSPFASHFITMIQQMFPKSKPITKHCRECCLCSRLRLHITRPNRYLVYISLINYVFNFCALRFILVIPLCWFCSSFDHFVFLFCIWPFKGLTRFLVVVLSCLRDHLIYARFDSFFYFFSRFEMSDEKEMDAKVFCK